MFCLTSFLGNLLIRLFGPFRSVSGTRDETPTGKARNPSV
jgi:hypothetical protein